MIWHPLLLAVLTLDTLALLLAVTAAASAFRIVLGWEPQRASREQIRLEIRAETASIQGRYAAAAFCLSTVALVAGITNVLPAVVPGAMCGTGVLQAAGNAGGRTLAFRFITVAVMFFWHLIDRLNRHRPDSPLATASARGLLLAAPLLLLAVTATLKAVIALDVHQPVDCCAVVYDQVRNIREAATGGGHLGDTHWIWGSLSGTVILFALGLRVRFSHSASSAVSGKSTWVLSALSLVWAPLAYAALVRTLAAYHYGVLEHHCPWCLFLPVHRLVGYPLLGALALVCLEGPSAAIAARVATRFPQLAEAASKRSRTAGLRVSLAALLFLLLAGLPPIIWRLRFGVWMG